MSTSDVIALASLFATIVVALVPGVYWFYKMHVRKPHKLELTLGNIALVPVASTLPDHNGKLALVIYSMTLVNVAPNPVTLKQLTLVYKFRHRNRRADLVAIPTGVVDGEPAIGLANANDQVVIAWSNLHEKFIRGEPVQPGRVFDANAVFILDVPINRIREISCFRLIVSDYSGGRSTHRLDVQEQWYKAYEQGFSLIDAAIAKTDALGAHWPGMTFTTKRFKV